ncbi:MAG: hypothetical protein WCT37_01870 [Patescibacteria group bacterium]|jgi:hypothetical protein
MNWRRKLAGLFRKVVKIYHNVFNLKLAVMSFFFNGIAAMVVNAVHPKEFLLAGIGSAIVGFFSTGVTGRVVQHFSPVKPEIKSYLLGSFVPASMTLTGYLLIHWWLGTTRLALTVAIPTLLSFGTSFLTNLATKSDHPWLKKFVRPPNYPDNSH